MDIIVKSPTKAIVRNLDEDTREKVTKALSYRNTSIGFQISKHLKNRWFKEKNPVEWAAHLKVLNSKAGDCLLKHDGKDHWIRPGSIPYLHKHTTSVVNEVQYPEFKPLKWKKTPDFEPFPYQAESIKRLMAVKHGNVSLPTGCGKSFILLLLAQQMGLDAVIVTPSQSIFNELLTEFQLRLGKDVVGGYGDGWKDIKQKITIAIGKSLTMLEEGTAAYEFFKNKKAVMVDESHTFAAEQLNDVCHGVLADAPYRMFVSATQTRNDGTEKVLASIIGENVLDMSLEDAIAQGYLCPLKFTIMATTAPKKLMKAPIPRDPTICKRKYFLYNENIAEIIAKIANGSWERRQQSTLVLVEELEQIEMLVKLLTVPFAYVHSADKKKAKEFNLEKVDLQESVQKFNSGEVKVLIGTKAIATGTNLYPTHNCCNWMGGSSEIVTKQGAMGRSTRRLEISKFKDLHTPKPYTMVYDFRVKGVEILDKQLVKRAEFYQEAKGEIKYY